MLFSSNQLRQVVFLPDCVNLQPDGSRMVVFLPNCVNLQPIIPMNFNQMQGIPQFNPAAGRGVLRGMPPGGMPLQPGRGMLTPQFPPPQRAESRFGGANNISTQHIQLNSEVHMLPQQQPAMHLTRGVNMQQPVMNFTQNVNVQQPQQVLHSPLVYQYVNVQHPLSQNDNLDYYPQQGQYGNQSMPFGDSMYSPLSMNPPDVPAPQSGMSLDGYASSASNSGSNSPSTVERNFLNRSVEVSDQDSCGISFNGDTLSVSNPSAPQSVMSLDGYASSASNSGSHSPSTDKRNFLNRSVEVSNQDSCGISFNGGLATSASKSDSINHWFSELVQGEYISENYLVKEVNNIKVWAPEIRNADVLADVENLMTIKRTTKKFNACLSAHVSSRNGRKKSITLAFQFPDKDSALEAMYGLLQAKICTPKFANLTDQTAKVCKYGAGASCVMPVLCTFFDYTKEGLREYMITKHEQNFMGRALKVLENIDYRTKLEPGSEKFRKFLDEKCEETEKMLVPEFKYDDALDVEAGLMCLIQRLLLSDHLASKAASIATFFNGDSNQWVRLFENRDSTQADVVKLWCSNFKKEKVRAKKEYLRRHLREKLEKPSSTIPPK